jgi:hypothetical protein
MPTSSPTSAKGAIPKPFEFRQDDRINGMKINVSPVILSNEVPWLEQFVV